MPFVRFWRDRRGYEHVYLVQPADRGGKGARARVLYWYRSPPGVKVGREPFDPAVRRRLEEQYPDISFDWDRIVSTPRPPPEIDWRERRRALRAAKEARRAEEDLEEAPEEAPEEDLEEAPDELPEDLPVDADAVEAAFVVADDRGGVAIQEPGAQEPAGQVDEAESEPAAVPDRPPLPAAAPVASFEPGPRRRRRRGGRRRRRARQGQEASPEPPESPATTGVPPGKPLPDGPPDSPDE